MERIGLIYPYIYPRLISPKGELRDTHVAVTRKDVCLDKMCLAVEFPTALDALTIMS